MLYCSDSGIHNNRDGVVLSGIYLHPGPIVTASAACRDVCFQLAINE